MSDGEPGDGAEHRHIPAVKKTARLVVAGEQGLALGLHVVDGQTVLTLNGFPLKDAENPTVSLSDGCAHVAFTVRIADGKR